MSLVARLEEVPSEAVEIAADQEVVQYRGEIMPLVRVSEVLGQQCHPAARRDHESLHVVVYTHNGRSIGLVVDRILDIVEEVFVMQTQNARKGILGSAVIQKRVTDILDVPGLIAGASQSRLQRKAEGEFVAKTQQFCTFFLEDQFFGVPVEQVQEVIRYQEVTRVPLVPAVIRGLINLRGQIVMAIDLRRRIGMPERPDSALPINVVVRTEDGAVSFLVDQIGDVLEVERDSFEHPPETLQGQAREMALGVYKLQDRLMLVLDTERAVNGTETETALR